jgi:hypothetical protein
LDKARDICKEIMRSLEESGSTQELIVKSKDGSVIIVSIKSRKSILRLLKDEEEEEEEEKTG